MIFKTILKTPDDAAAWGNPGRIPALYVSPDESHIVIATDCRLTNPGSNDLNKGDDYRIGFKVSTDGGATFSALAYAIDQHLTTDGTLTGIGFTDPSLVPANGGNDLYLFCSSDKGLTAGQSPFTSLSRIAYSKATKAGGFADWSAPTYFPVISGFDTNNVSSGQGFYDPDTDTVVVPCYGYKTSDRWTPFCLYKVGAGDWTKGADIPVTGPAPGGENENRVIKSSDGFWYMMTRFNTVAANTVRPLYRASTPAGPWSPVPSSGKIYASSNNLGLCVTAINGEEAWLYTDAGYPSTQVSTGASLSALRKFGELLISFDNGLSWGRSAALSSRDPSSTDSFFAYSCVMASACNIYVLFESNNYTSIRLCKIAKSELTV